MAKGNGLINGAWHAEMYMHEQTDPVVIQEAAEWHLVKDFTSGTCSGFTFEAGKQLVITAYADNGDSKTKVSVNGHGMDNGDVISIANTANYDGIWLVEQVDTNDFVINTLFAGDDGASVGEQGSGLRCDNARSAGLYLCLYSISFTPAQNGNVWEASIFQNAAYKTNLEIQRKTGTAADFGVAMTCGLLTIASGDHVGLAMKNLTAAQNATIRNANLSLVMAG